MSLDSVTEQIIAGLIVAAVVAAVGLLVRRRRQRRNEEANDDARDAPRPSALDEKAYRLLEAIHDLAGGNPGNYVATVEAAQNAEIPNTTQDLDTILRHLLNNRLLATPYAGLSVVTITPEGTRVVNERRR